MNVMRLCYDRRAIAALVAVGVAVVLFAPQLLPAVAPILILAACPLSMMLMLGMATARGSTPTSTPAAAETPADRADRLRRGLADAQREQRRLTRELEALHPDAPLPATIARTSPHR